MYKELTIKNIKIFKEEQKLKIAPITLLYGENSSGKTTLLKTFDIIHNIFSEQDVKRGKNVGQKDSPFYRNENIQNISPKKIHYYSNQINKKPQNISIVLDTVIDDENLKHIFRDTLTSSKVASQTEQIFSAFQAPIKVKLTIKYFPKKKISKVDLIKIETIDGKTLMSFSRINKNYPKINESFNSGKVGYIAPRFDKILSRPNRYSSAYHRGRPIAEEDYFVDDALYADYKFKIEANSIWEKEYSVYEEIFKNDKLVNGRHEKIKILLKTLNDFRDLELNSNTYVKFRTFAYFLSKQLLTSKEKNINKFKRRFDEYLEKTKKNKKLSKVSYANKLWYEKVLKLQIRDAKKYTKLNPFLPINFVRTLKQRNFAQEYLFSSTISRSGHTNLKLIERLINKKDSKKQFIRSGKLDSQLFDMRFSKRSSFVNPELVREGYASDTSLDIVRSLSEYINGDLEGTFSRKNKFGFDFVQAKSFNASQLINNLMIKIRHIVSNFIICHPSKTNVDWHVANERDLPTNVRKSLDAMEAELKKKNILRGGPYIVDAALAGVKAVIKNASNKNISKQDEMIRQRNLERSKKSIKAENIVADGRNFHNAIINDDKFRSKLNKTLKELLNLELLIVTPKFLKELLQDPSRYQRFRNAQRSGAMYPTGMGRYNRTKFIMLRDLKFKKSFHIHGEEIGKGPTNILPFLAQILSDKPGLTYIIQELENNWHPKYQSKIIELIAKNMKKSQEQGEQGYGNKNFILETHSELFVLQIKKLIEQGILKPEDVSINFIERTKDGNSKVHNIPLNPQGSFTKEWPGGFFTERTEVLTS